MKSREFDSLPDVLADRGVGAIAARCGTTVACRWFLRRHRADAMRVRSPRCRDARGSDGKRIPPIDVTNYWCTGRCGVRRAALPGY